MIDVKTDLNKLVEFLMKDVFCKWLIRLTITTGALWFIGWALYDTLARWSLL